MGRANTTDLASTQKKEARRALRCTLRHKLEQDQITLSLHTLQYCLGLSPYCPEEFNIRLSRYAISSDFSDAVLVALDIEGTKAREIGFSILDTRSFSASVLTDPNPSIQTYNYIIRQNEVKTIQRQFKYGISQRIDIRWVPWGLNKVLKTGSPDPAITEARNVILIGHNIGSDFGMLLRAGIRFEQVLKIPVVDTRVACLQIFQKESMQPSPGLEELVERLNVDKLRNWKHVAGNDANVTLKVLLKMVIHSCDMWSMTGKERERRELLNSVVEANRANGWDATNSIVDVHVSMFTDAEFEAQKREVQADDMRQAILEAMKSKEQSKDKTEVKYDCSEMTEVCCAGIFDD
ncbi:uncharacterized protein LY89DRAFT_733605 [Mollisia scopiformis]|uniref:Gfd2/YDR514C-like C-terminal domain-containing protein n=1 Tax=Mollisia scopiformis TaxID=149040 RepID=A0A194XC84_MOLSC|nr:uncharacterized protein LY89DRAFT_733605 [Mollisia scopiformis]KUJ17783.1 hypothetical protein LY89DRAFT_733605 [Mollisia scopiformis]